jgi:hypothetical protein
MKSARYKVDIFRIYGYKIFADSQENLNVQYSISGMFTLPDGTEQYMDDEKEMINCASQDL